MKKAIDGRIAANKLRQKITDEEILAGIDAGLTRQEIADKHGVHVENLARRMKRLGVHARYASSASSKPKEITNTWHYTEGGKAFIDNTCAGRFEFVAYKKGRYRIKCKKCGCISERSGSTIRRCNVKCDECKRKEQIKRERARQARSIFAPSFLECKCCGVLFVTEYEGQLYCSKACKAKAKKQRAKERNPEAIRARRKAWKKTYGGKYISRAKKYGCVWECGVTLKAVIKRDKGICQICGKPCDENDKTWGSAGPLYPSVDHIIPLSKQGPHTWGNVQLAHLICNSEKRDLITV